MSSSACTYHLIAQQLLVNSGKLKVAGSKHIKVYIS